VPLAHVSIEEMAAFYVEEIRRKQPCGPYLLGGMCAGGVIPYEMASQLVRSGESVELVAILDAILPGIQERPGRAREERLDRLKGTFAHTQSSDVGFWKRAGIITGAVSQKLLNTLLWQISHRGQQLSARVRFQLLHVILSRDLEWPRFVPELTLREIYDGAAARYTPKPLSISSVVLVRATTGEGEDTPYREIYADPSFGWATIAPGLRTVDVDGGHTTMLQETFVDSLAEALMPYLLEKAAPTVHEHQHEAALI
jgi:thioesterase domain-containing protein